jgi:hypothetical protein
MRCRMRHLQLTCCSSCRLTSTADKDPAYSFDIFIRHTWTLCTFLVQNTPGLLKLFVPGTYRWSCWWRTVMRCSGSLWTCESDFVSINHSTHYAFSCEFMVTELIRRHGCSAVENNALYRELIETLKVSLADDAQCLCIFIKVLFTSKVVEIIYIHPCIRTS